MIPSYSERGALGAAARWKNHIVERTPEKRREYLKRYHQQYRRTSPRVEHEKYESEREYQRRWKKANRLKANAHLIVHRAVKRGLLQREPCKLCNEANVHAHHHNGYENALDVVWLCPAHHRAEHGQE